MKEIALSLVWISSQGSPFLAHDQYNPPVVEIDEDASLHRFKGKMTLSFRDKQTGMALPELGGQQLDTETLCSFYTSEFVKAYKASLIGECWVTRDNDSHAYRIFTTSCDYTGENQEPMCEYFPEFRLKGF